MLHFSVGLHIILFIYILENVNSYPSIHGRYTRGIDDYQLVIPHKLTHQGKFLTFALPHYFRHRKDTLRRRRAIEDAIHYGLLLSGKRHHVELWPNHDFLSPDTAFETRDATEKVQNRYIRKVDSVKLCHFTGRIRHHPDSRVAISTCNGLAGYILLNGRRYYVEPLSEHGPNKRGHHLHMIYEQANDPVRYTRHCGTTANWTESWKDSLRKNYMKYGGFKNETRRGAASVHRYLETLIVADKKFLQHYKNTDFETYILTIMNMVSDHYHDPSSGNMMDVVVVRVIFLEREEEEIDLVINPDSDATLASFCKWQLTVNPKDIHSPNHHDIAVLLTRHDLCATEDGNCGLMGLAYVAAACDPEKSCAINEDSGLILSIVVTHEMGHVMGCDHDKSGESACEAKLPDKSYTVMAPSVHLNTRQWSTCSKTFITTFFNNDLGECLNDEPQQSIYNYPNILPGVVYDGDYQCRMTYPGTTQCHSDPTKACTMLMCTAENSNSCNSNGEPPADGTKCGENKWCYKMKCVPRGQRPEAINGGWGEWGEFSACTRTCGGGVSSATRECNNPVPQHSGRYCLGERKKIKFCNTQPCAEGAPTFREVQCAEFDNKLTQGAVTTWKAFIVDDAPCDLFCLNKENVYSKLAPRAKDGTRCKKGTKDTCIGGVCTKVGCDFEMNSQAIEDICGVCKGDGTTCKIIDRTYNAPPGHEYVKITTVPKGSRNLRFEENAPSDNSIAISDEGGQYFLNGNFVEEPDQPKKIGDDEGIYSHPEPKKELFVMKGPLKISLVLYVVYYRPENVGYRYTYADPSSHSDYKPSYHWEVVNYGDCSVRCGSGSQIAEPDCLEEKAGKVSATFCHNLEKPQVMTRVCNEKPCETKWRIGKWSKCNACKNKSGVRVREVECVRESPVKGSDDVLVEDDQCPAPKPGTRELCDSRARCISTRRSEYELPAEMMEELWYQTVIDYIDVDPTVRRDVVACDARTRRMINHNLKRHLRARKACPVPGIRPPGPNAPAAPTAPTAPSAPAAPTKGGKVPGLHVGSIVKDKVPPDEIQLIEVPMNRCSLNMNISDTSFETVGDEVVDSMDFEHQKVHTGKEAVELLKVAQTVKNSSLS